VPLGDVAQQHHVHVVPEEVAAVAVGEPHHLREPPRVQVQVELLGERGPLGRSGRPGRGSRHRAVSQPLVEPERQDLGREAREVSEVPFDAPNAGNSRSSANAEEPAPAEGGRQKELLSEPSDVTRLRPRIAVAISVERSRAEDPDTATPTWPRSSTRRTNRSQPGTTWTSSRTSRPGTRAAGGWRRHHASRSPPRDAASMPSNRSSSSETYRVSPGSSPAALAAAISPNNNQVFPDRRIPITASAFPGSLRVRTPQPSAAGRPSSPSSDHGFSSTRRTTLASLPPCAPSM
jgi:hypothetical protein